jgi:hypothetical protein
MYRGRTIKTAPPQILVEPAIDRDVRDRPPDIRSVTSSFTDFPGSVNDVARGSGVVQAQTARHQLSTRYLFAAVRSIVRSVRARA